MPRCVSKSWDTHDAAVIEEIIFSVDQIKIMTVIIVFEGKAIRLDQVGLVCGSPFALLNNEPRVGHLPVTPAVVKMKV